jgi:hypothetical protein
MEGRMLLTFLASLGGFTAFFLLLYRAECRLEEALSRMGDIS